LEGPSNGCEECLFQWIFLRRGLHLSTTWFLGVREGASSLQIEEDSIWSEASTQGMEHQD
jgi:hypothetical protein